MKRSKQHNPKLIRLFSQLLTLTLLLAGATQVGCTSLLNPINGIPANRVPAQFLAEPKNNFVPIDVSLLAQEPPRDYLLDEGDILGIYLEGILPFTPPDQPPALPPVNFPTADSTLPPSVGFPVTIIGDGTITLPSIEPLKIQGLTLEQVRDLIRKAYLDAKIFSEADGKKVAPIVSLIREREVNVIVVRQDVGTQRINQRIDNFNRGGFTRGADESASGSAIKLKAGENDILHALIASGGLPGVNAKNEIRVLRASDVDRESREEFIRQFYAQQEACQNNNPCYCPPPLPDDPNVLRIPLRLPPGVSPTFAPEDVLLEEGDIIYIESREAEVFYTGGLLNGGEFPLPRDYDLDVLGAIAIAGAGVASPGSGGVGNLARGIGGVPPGIVYILRPLPCNGQITIAVDLNEAVRNPRARPLIQPGDTLILRFKPQEELVNFGLGTFFTFGIQAIFRNL